MSKASDELREYCKGLYKGEPNYMTLMAIADRIDREMMERPLAADGKLLVDGETVYDSNGHEYHVNEVYPLVNVSTSTYSGTRRPETLTHKRPDSWERIAHELEEWSEDNAVDGNHEVFNRAADFADRIRKLAEMEG